MALHQNEAEATEAIREAKTHCGLTIREAEAWCTTLTREAESHHAIHIREAEATCATYIKEAEAKCAWIIMEAEANCTSIIAEAEACCTTDVRKLESCCAEHACSIQQLHTEGMQHLEMEAIEEEGRHCLYFLATCGTALQACPPETHGVLRGPLQLLMGNMSLATPSECSPQVSSTREEPTLVVSQLTTLAAPRPSPQTKQWHSLPDQVVSSPQSGGKDEVASEEPPCLKWKDEMPFKKSLTGSWHDAFAKDSNLVQQAREDYFKTNCPCFDCKTSCNLTNVFWDMITYAGLLGFQIYKIQEVWMEWKDLQYANNVLKIHQSVCSFSAVLYHLQNCPRSWAWQVFITQMPFATLPAWPCVLGVERKGKMKGL